MTSRLPPTSCRSNSSGPAVEKSSTTDGACRRKLNKTRDSERVSFVTSASTVPSLSVRLRFAETAPALLQKRSTAWKRSCDAS
jgi:hypothetical protein